MEKGIEAEEKDLYKQAENVANNVLNSLDGINPNINFNSGYDNTDSFNNIDFNKLSNILYETFLKALNSCKMQLDEDGFIRFIKDELYKVV